MQKRLLKCSVGNLPMNEYSVKITPQANEQMQEIFIYISKTLCVPDTALRLLNELKKAIMSLARMPKRVALTEEEPWRSYGVHKMAVKNFLVYFWIDDKRNEVHVIAVIYGRRDQLEALKGL